MPNHRMKTGRNAIFGDGKPSATSGSSSQCSDAAARHRDAEQDAGDRRERQARANARYRLMREIGRQRCRRRMTVHELRHHGA